MVSAVLALALLPIHPLTAGERGPGVEGFTRPTVQLQNPQDSQALLERANSFGSRFAGKVRNERLTLNWLPSGKAWYTRQTSTGQNEFIVVDPVKKSKQLAFDHAKVREAFEKAVGKPTPVLPARQARLSDDLKRVTLYQDGFIEIDLKTFATRKGIPKDLPGLKAYAPQEVTRSGGGGEQTSITFLNQSQETLRIWWLQDDGKPREYKTLAPGEEWTIQTWVSHYWLVTRQDETKLAVYMPDRNGSAAFLDGKPVAYNPPTAPRPGASPDGRHQVTFRNHQALLNGEPITTTGTAENRFTGPAWWSPDSKTVAFYQVVPEESRPLNIVITTPPDQFQPRLTSRQYLKPGDRTAKPILHLYRVDDKRLIKTDDQLYSNPFDLSHEQWLDADRFVFRYNQRGHQVLRLLAVDAKTGETKTLIEETSPTFIDWTNKTDFRFLKDNTQILWQSERSGWSHFYRYDLKTGQPQGLTTGNWVVRDLDSLDEAKDEAILQISGHPLSKSSLSRPESLGPDPYHIHFARLQLSTGKLTLLTEGDGNHRVTFSPDRRYLVDTYSRADLPPVHELRDAKSGQKILDLEAADATELLKAGFRMPRRFVAKGRDGKTDIWGHLYFPSDFDPKKSYPVVEDIYAGPHSAHVPKNFHTNAGGMQVAELGFIVVRIDGMGTNHRGKAFHDVCWKNLADAGFPDRIAWMKAAAQVIPQMDLTRVGIYGTSAGGQNALHAVLLHGDFYKVAVADCGCYDNRMDKIWWNEQWMGWPVGPHYEAQSGRTLAPRLQGKLMLLIGEEDTNVDPASTYQVVDALIRADKDFDLIVLPNVGHGAVGHPYGRRKMREFLMRHLVSPSPK